MFNTEYLRIKVQKWRCRDDPPGTAILLFPLFFHQSSGYSSEQTYFWYSPLLSVSFALVFSRSYCLSCSVSAFWVLGVLVFRNVVLSAISAFPAFSACPNLLRHRSSPSIPYALTIKRADRNPQPPAHPYALRFLAGPGSFSAEHTASIRPSAAVR